LTATVSAYNLHFKVLLCLKQTAQEKVPYLGLMAYICKYIAAKVFIICSIKYVGSSFLQEAKIIHSQELQLGTKALEN